MKLVYLTHHPIDIKDGQITVVATTSFAAYTDFVQGFQGKDTLIKFNTDDYDVLPTAKAIDWIGDPLLSKDICKQYLTDALSLVFSDLTDSSRMAIQRGWNQVLADLEKAIFMEDLPLAVSTDLDFKKLLKFSNLHFNDDIASSPYGIIETVVKIHQACGLKSTIMLSNLSHYLDQSHFNELNKLIKETNLSLILLEFDSDKHQSFYKEASFNYIDADLVDWY